LTAFGRRPLDLLVQAGVLSEAWTICGLPDFRPMADFAVFTSRTGSTAGVSYRVLNYP
jgi:hypothetical protein